MVTPLMWILSSLDADYKYDKPYTLSYLSKSDRADLLSEIRWIGYQLTNEDKILPKYDDNFEICRDANGDPIIDTVQLISGELTPIHPATAALLTRLVKAYKIFDKHIIEISSIDEKDLGDDDIVLRIEGNPNYVYDYVIQLMSQRRASYESKIQRLAELLATILGHSMFGSGDSYVEKMIERMQLHSKSSYWIRMLTSDVIRSSNSISDPITVETLGIVKKELKLMGFYGFVNPLQMYLDFASSRITKKSEINVDSSVIKYLDKVVRSGGSIS